MIYPSQAEFVADCINKYWFTDIPADQQWEAAHYPLPQCSGEDDTVQLWSADHTVQGLLQSVEFDHQCFHGKANKKDLHNLTNYWPAYLPLFAQLKSEFAKRRGKANCHQGHHTCAELKLGFHAPGVRSAGGKIGGKKSAAQRYQCLVTGHICNAGPLTRYQRARGIDTSLRQRVYCATANPTLKLQ